MANSQSRVTLVFDADTGKAKQSVNDLYSTLEKLSRLNMNNNPGRLLNKDIQEASMAATQLKLNLENAVNVNTGRLDLNKFNQSLQKSKMTLSDYQRILTACGPAGQQAFTQLAKSIVTADVSVIRLSDRMRALGTTLANTIKWQAASSLVHGMVGALSSAYNYAQDLNESLNNIRIVTGYSVDQMKDFAKEANRAAQALSTSTTRYTDAALIFYQQGLSSDAVKERTDAVIKLANVTGETAEQVSEYMTAIWNNYYTGAQSLEYYADVLTKLGAATASSSDEIAGGLEKFSAVAQTIGLSYEYAASALATITAKTRESEDVVGTALKTIFARIQGLNLGETLEDGVDLNKYSKALASIGISIIDNNGELKQMDMILDEMGNKWNNLTKAEQTALAQTVAGVRQYNQLVALMDNWDDFKINVDLALDSEGTLSEQMAIVEESWAGASRRLKAAFEDMYDSLINDEAFIDLTDFFTNFIQSITATIDSIGGLKGILLILGSTLLKVFSPQVGQALDTIGLKVQRIATGTNAGLAQTKQEAVNMLGQSYASSGDFSGAAQAVAAENMGTVNAEYLASAEKLAPFQKKIAESLLQQQNALNEAAIKQGEIVKLTEARYEKEKKGLDVTRLAGGRINPSDKNKVHYNKQFAWGENEGDTFVETEEGKTQKAALTSVMKKAGIDQSKVEINDMGFNTDKETAIKLQTEAVKQYTEAISQANMMQSTFLDSVSTVDVESNRMSNLADELKSAGTNFEQLNQVMESADFKTVESAIDSGVAHLDALEATLKKQGKSFEQAFGKKGAASIKKYSTQLKQAQAAQKKMSTASQNLVKIEKDLANARAKGKATDGLEKQRLQAQEALTSATKEYTAAVQGNGQAQSSLKAIFDQVGVEIKELTMDANTAKAALQALGYSETQLNALEEACEQMNIDFTQLVAVLAAAKNGGQQFEGQMSKLVSSSNTMGQTLSKIGSAASQVAMGLTAVAGIGDIWRNQDISVGEKLTSTMMNLAMVLPMVGTAIDAVRKIKLLMTAQSQAAKGAIEAETLAQMKQMGITSLETAGLWGKAAAWIAAHPLLAGVALAAAAAGIALMVIMTKQEERQAEATKQAAEAAKEKAEAEKKEAEANKSLMDQYDEAQRKYKETGEGKQELIEISLDVAKAYGIEGAAIDALSGDYDKLTKKIIQARKEEIKRLKGTNSSGATATNKVMSDKLREGDGRLRGDGSYYGQFDNGASDADEKAAHQAIAEGNYKYLSQTGGEIAFTVQDMSDPRQMYEYYTELQRFAEEQRRIAEEQGINLSASEIYQDILDELAQGKDQYEELKQYFEDNAQLQLELSSYETKILQNGKEQTIDEIDSMEEYSLFLEQFKKDYAEAMGYTADATDDLGKQQWEEATKAATNYLSNLEQFKDFHAWSQGFEDLAGHEDIDKIKEYFNSLSDEEKTLFWSIGINEATSFNYIVAYMKNAQDYLDFNKLYASIEVKDNALELWKSGNFDELKKLFEGEDNPYGISWEQFISKSYAEAEAILTHAAEENPLPGLIKEYNDSMTLGAESIANAQGQYQVAKGNANKGRQDYNQAVTNNQPIVDQANKNISFVNTAKTYADGKFAFDNGTFLRHDYINDVDSFSGGAYLNYILQNGVVDTSVLTEGTQGNLDNFVKMLNIDEEDPNRDRQIDDYMASQGMALADKMAKAMNEKYGVESYSAAGMAEYLYNILRFGTDSANANTKDWHVKGVSGLLTLIESESAGSKNAAQGAIDDAAAESARLDGLAEDAQGKLRDTNNEVNANANTARLKIEALLSSQLQAVNSLTEFEQIINANNSVLNGLDYQVVADGLIKLGSQYASCTDEINNYQQALLSEDQMQIDAAESSLKGAILIEEAAAKYNLNAELLKYSAEMLQSDEALNLSAESAARMAVENARMNEGLVTLIENSETWFDVLDNGDTNSAEYASTLADLSEVIQDLTGASEDWNISGAFMIENLELIKKAAKQDEKAIARLGILLAKDQFKNLTASDAQKKSTFSAEVNEYTSKWANDAVHSGGYYQDRDFVAYDGQTLEDGQIATAEAAWERAKAIVTNGMDVLDQAIADGTLSIGDSLSSLDGLTGPDGMKFDSTEWINSMNQMAEATGMSVEEMNSYLSSLGVDAEVTTKDVDTSEWVRGYTIKWDEDTKTASVEPGELTKVPGKKTVAAINGDIKYTGNGTINSVTKPSDGGGSPKKLERKKKSDVIDRYKEINDQLETSRRLMEKTQREADSLWGPARLKKMAEVTREMERQNKLLKQKAALAQRYLDEGSKNDQQDLIDIITKSVGEGVFTYDDLFDAEGNFIGYDEVTDILWKRVEDAENAVKNPEDVTDAEQQAIDDAEKVVADVLDAVGLYDETRQTALDAIAEYEQGILNIQQAAFDELTAKMELEIEINDSDLEKLDYYLNKLSEDIWDMGERLTLMVGQLGEDGVLNLEDSQLDNYLENLDTYEAAYNDLVTQYTTINPETGKTYINQDQFIQGLKDLNSKIYSELGNLQELENTMTSAIADAYAAADETLAKYTDTMSHHISVLDHFMTLMDLLGESKNYDAMKAIAEGQVELAENMATVSKETYDMKKTALDTQIDRMKEAGFTNDEGEFDLFAISEQDMTEEQRIIREGYQAAVTAAQEAEDQMLADAATWAEALKSLLETELAELADILNKNLSGEFGSLDQLSLAMERKNSLQEEYLTTTNKIYETEKMMRTAQQEIDKTTNSVAKRRFKQFIEETEQLQNQNKLSQHELNIQQAKYDLLLAEIALEEAQNAKSTVRLQRDAEGNFGYVYTADQNKVADAEQKLADAQNSLYNIGLEGANDYAQKYADTIAEMNDEITALSEARMNGDIASEEEYRKQKDAIIAHYYEKLNNYSHLYQASLGVDGRIIDDAWSTQFGSMTSNTEQWMQYVKDYAGQATLAFQDYFTAIEPIAQYTIGKDASDAAAKTAEIVTNNQKITEEITKDGGVLDALGMQLHSVSDIVDGYLAMRETIQGAIDDAEELARVSNQTLHNESDEDPDNDLKPADNATPPADPPTNPDPPPEPQPGSEEELELGSEVKVKAGTRWYADSWGGGNSGPAQDGKITIIKEENSHGYHIKGSQYGSGWVKKTDIEGFDTGGYTGAWGSYGKMAMLHEKELVLNQGDTANFLASMEVLERILQILDLQAFSSQMGGLLSSPGFRESGSQNIQQHIEINAEFPNATDRFEIEEAFKSMANLASQYANQK